MIRKISFLFLYFKWQRCFLSGGEELVLPCCKTTAWSQPTWRPVQALDAVCSLPNSADAEHFPCTMHAFCVSSPKQENKCKLEERYGLNSISAAFCIPTTSLEPTPQAGARLLLASAPSAPVIKQPWLHSGSHSRGRGQKRCICTTSCKICRVGSIHQLSRQSPHGCG